VFVFWAVRGWRLRSLLLHLRWWRYGWRQLQVTSEDHCRRQAIRENRSQDLVENIVRNALLLGELIGQRFCFALPNDPSLDVDHSHSRVVDRVSKIYAGFSIGHSCEACDGRVLIDPQLRESLAKFGESLRICGNEFKCFYWHLLKPRRLSPEASCRFKLSLRRISPAE